MFFPTESDWHRPGQQHRGSRIVDGPGVSGGETMSDTGIETGREAGRSGAGTLDGAAVVPLQCADLAAAAEGRSGANEDRVPDKDCDCCSDAEDKAVLVDLLLQADQDASAARVEADVMRSLCEYISSSLEAGDVERLFAPTGRFHVDGAPEIVIERMANRMLRDRLAMLGIKGGAQTIRFHRPQAPRPDASTAKIVAFPRCKVDP